MRRDVQRRVRHRGGQRDRRLLRKNRVQLDDVPHERDHLDLLARCAAYAAVGLRYVETTRDLLDGAILAIISTCSVDYRYQKQRVPTDNLVSPHFIALLSIFRQSGGALNVASSLLPFSSTRTRLYHQRL